MYRRVLITRYRLAAERLEQSYWSKHFRKSISATSQPLDISLRPAPARVGHHRADSQLVLLSTSDGKMTRFLNTKTSESNRYLEAAALSLVGAAMARRFSISDPGAL